MKTRIGVVGCGAISDRYFENMTHIFPQLEIAGICDLISERAEEASKKHGIARIYSDMHELMADPSVDIVLNLTRPYEHFDVSMAAIAAGKHIYSEKPLGATLDEGRRIIAAAKEKGVMVGGAPDTYLGAGIQTCRKLIDDGFIGTPVGASAFMVGRGPESWHPDPEFFYKFGGGPLFDMGPYYLSALLALLGPVGSVSGMARKSFATRTIGSEPHRGTVVDVEVDTYVNALLQFESGAIGTLFTTFDVYAAEVPRIEVYGSSGTLSVPDPNTFGGPVRLYRPEKGEFTEIPLLFPYEDNCRGIGLVDMASAVSGGNTTFRPCSDITFHVLELMCGIIKSEQTGARVQIESKPNRPAPMPMN